MSDLTDAERKQLMERYRAASHAMQSGVAVLIEQGSRETEPKDLRVGVNSAMVDSAALAKLLLAKGVFTEREYLTALAEMMEAEAKNYQDSVQAVLSTGKVILR